MHIGNVRGLPSPSPASSCCLTQIETETLACFFFFFLCLMCLFLSLQLTASSNLTISHIQESGGIAFKSARGVSVLHACFCVSAPVWEAGQVMAGWNHGSGLSRPHLRPVCAAVSACLISVWKSGSRWDVRLRSGSDTIVLSTLFQVRCVDCELSGHMLSWLDFS